MDTPEQDIGQRLRAFFTGAEAGFFVEVGVRGPIGASPSRHLEQAGWAGVLVEPQPDVAAFLVTSRSAKVFAAACVAADMAGKPMALRVASPLVSAELDRSSAASSPDYVIMVPTRTLDDVLREAEAPAPLELLILDAGGRELEALLGFQFELWRPRLLLIADPIFDRQRHRFLKESGYRLIGRAEGCGWYVPAESAAVIGGRERFELVRQYYLALPFRMARHALWRLGRRIKASAE